MGIEVTDSADIIEFSKCFSKLEDLVAQRLYKVWLYSDWIYKLTPYAKETNKNVTFILNFSKKVIFRY